MKANIQVVAAVIEHNGHILAAQRGPTMSHSGQWELPGGKIEAGETPEQALQREIEEELLCTVDVGTHILTADYEYEHVKVTLSSYHCTLIAGHPTATEHAELRWLDRTDPNQLRTLAWSPADLATIDALLGAV